MASPFATLDARLRRLPDLAILFLGLALIGGLAALKLSLGHGVPMVDFFLIPVAGVGWLASSPSWGCLAALAAAVVSVVLAEVGTSPAPLGATLTAGFARLVFYVVVLALLAAMRRMQFAHESDALTDALTGAANARAFRDLAEAEVERSQRYQHELSLAYLDIDDFKAINDRLGHAEGDHVLLQVSHVMRSSVRGVDTVARLGGDEFAVLMPETRPAEARAVVERIRGELARLRTSAGGLVPCSIGLVTFDRPPLSAEELIAAGDDLMYRAKQNGKDRVEQAERAGSWARRAPLQSV